MFPLSPHSTAPTFAIGEPVRVTSPVGEVAPGAEGRVVGYYRDDPPRTLVAFEGVARAVPDSGLERAGS
jgi:hypothetical protein